MNWQEKSKEEGFRIRHFTGNNRILATLIADTKPNPDGKVGYGIAVVSPKDSPNKNVGRRIAYNRYLQSKTSRAPKVVYANIIKLSIPVYGQLTTDDIKEMIKTLKAYEATQ